MNLKLSLRVSLLALAGLLAACGSGGSDNECLIEDAGFCDGAGSSSGGGGAARVLTLTCPPSVTAGDQGQGFSAVLGNGGGAGIKNSFIGLVPSLSDGTPAGTITGLDSDGSALEGGGFTDSTGKAIFSLKAPANGTSIYKVSVKATYTFPATGASPSTRAPLTATCNVNVTPNPVRLTIVGPNNEPTGAIELEAGKAKSGFIARLTDSTGKPIPDIELTSLVAQSERLSNAGTITTPGTGIVTDEDGRVFFRYQSPNTVTDVSDVNLVATAKANGFTVTKSYLVRVYPAAVEPPAPLPTLNVTAPSGQASGSVQLVSGQTTTGFFVQLLNGDGAPVVGQTVTLGLTPGSGSAKAADAGAVRATPPISSSQPNVGRTNSEGKVLFEIRAPTTESASVQLYTVTASTTLNGSSVTGEFTVRVLPRGVPQLLLSAAANQPSSSVTLASGERFNSLVATLKDGQGKPLQGVSLSTTATLGKISLPGATTTDVDGRLTFDYTAPTGVAEEQQVIIKVSGTADGYQIPVAEYVLNIAPTVIEITGPSGAPSDSVTVVAGKSLSGFRLRLTDGAARPLPGVTVTLRPRTSGGGTAATVAGTLTQNRNTTDSDGVITFSYTAPRPDSASDLPILIGATARVGSDSITTDYGLTVISRGVPKLVLRGPADEPSGRLEVEADNIAAGLSVTFTDGLGEPISNKSVTLTPSTGTIQIADDSTDFTDSNGQIRFDYTAPVTVSTRTRATITARGSADGSTLTSTYQVTLVPTPPAAAPRMTLIGPTEASPAQKRTGYSATFIRADGQAIEGVPIRFTISNGTIAIVENGVERPGISTGRTDAFGRVGFVLTPSSGAIDTTVQVNATYDGTAAGSTADLTNQCQNLTTCAASLNVTVRADTFRFIAPVYGANVSVGEPNAQPLSFRWQDSAGAGVPRCIDLDASFQGSSDAPFGLIVSGDPTPRTQVRRVQLNSAGEIQTGVAIYSDRSGFVAITARENRDCLAGGSATTGLSASTGVQFVDQPGTANNHVDLDAPLKVQESADTGSQRRVTITLEVRNDAYGRLDGEQVLFCLVPGPTETRTTVTTTTSSSTPPTTTSSTSTSGRSLDINERVFPGGGTTNSEGIATTQYFVPALGLTSETTQNSTTQSTTVTQTATVDISGCVRRSSCSTSNDGQVCSTRRVQITPNTQ